MRFDTAVGKARRGVAYFAPVVRFTPLSPILLASLKGLGHGVQYSGEYSPWNFAFFKNKNTIIYLIFKIEWQKSEQTHKFGGGVGRFGAAIFQTQIRIRSREKRDAP